MCGHQDLHWVIKLLVRGCLAKVRLGSIYKNVLDMTPVDVIVCLSGQKSA